MNTTATSTKVDSKSSLIPNHLVMTMYRYQPYREDVLQLNNLHACNSVPKLTCVCWLLYSWKLLMAISCCPNVLIVVRPCKVVEMWEYTGLRAASKEWHSLQHALTGNDVPMASSLLTSREVFRKYQRMRRNRNTTTGMGTSTYGLAAAATQRTPMNLRRSCKYTYAMVPQWNTRKLYSTPSITQTPLSHKNLPCVRMSEMSG